MKNEIGLLKEILIDELSISDSEEESINNKVIINVCMAPAERFLTFKKEFKKDFFERFFLSYYWPFFETQEFMNDLKNELECYEKFKVYEEKYTSEIIRWYPNDREKGSWEECLESVEWNINKIKERGSDKPFIEPKGDNRYRVYKSIKLWVMNGSWEGQPDKGSVVGIVDEIERKVYHSKTSNKRWVMYNSEVHLLHNRFEFTNLITAARRGDIDFFSNLHQSPDMLRDIVAKEFILGPRKVNIR